MKEIVYKPCGVCCKSIEVGVENGKIKSVVFTGGCNGNLQGISALLNDMDIKDVASRLKGIDCNGKGTSCPDQLAQCLEKHF